MPSDQHLSDDINRAPDFETYKKLFSRADSDVVDSTNTHDPFLEPKIFHKST